MNSHIFEGLLDIQEFCDKIPEPAICYALNLARNSDKMRCIYNLLKDNELLPPKNLVKTEKSEQKAIEARNIGDYQFQQNDYVKALSAYNQSLCWAPIGSESIGIAFANRSNIYLKCGFYKFCLENIGLASRNNYPERMKMILVQREEECLDRMKTEEDSADIYDDIEPIELSYPANPKIPFVIDCLKLKNNEKYGRHIVTNQDLKPGDIILSEDPFVKVLYGSGCFTNCYNCSSNNFFNLRPSINSTKAMFCCKRCLQDASDGFYKYEKDVIDGILKMTPNGAERVALNALTIFSSDLEELKKLVDTEYLPDFDMTPLDEKTKLRALLNLATNEDKLQPIFLLFHALKVVLAFHMLKEFSELREVFEIKENEDLFLEILWRLQLIGSANGSVLANLFERNEVNQFSSEVLGNSISLFLCYFNHSCSPNARKFIDKSNKVGLMVILPIKAEEQVCISYGVDHNVVPFCERQHFLGYKYCFFCTCQACLENYPQITNISQINLISKELWESINSLISAECEYEDRNARKLTEEVMNEIVKLMEDYDEYYPCLEYGVIQSTLIFCMHKLIHKKPLDLILSPLPAQPREVQISKTLSYILRHGAEKEKLPIDKEGFIDLKVLLNHRTLKMKKATEEDILEIVQNDTKKRFNLEKSDKGLRIRANQGHSVTTVNISMERLYQVDHPVVHGTFYSCWSKIKDEGLNKMKRQHIHFATSDTNSELGRSGLRANTDVLIYVNFEKAIEDGIIFFKSDNGVVLTEGLNGVLHPKYFLKVLDRRKDILLN